MALIRTTTTAKVGAGDLLIPVASTATGFPAVGLISNPQQQMIIDTEVMFIVQVPQANLVQVRSRGADGTLAIPHDINAPVLVSSAVAAAQDFPTPVAGASTQNPWQFPDQITYGSSGAITVPLKETGVYLGGTAALAMTLGAPSLASNGVRVFLTATTAFAHTVTTPGVTGTTGLFNTGATGQPFTIASFNGLVGASFVLEAQNGAWNLISANGVTFT